MDFLNYLSNYEKEDVKSVKKIVKENRVKTNTVLKEAFFGDFVNKEEAKLRISTEFIDVKKAPKSIDVKYVKENLDTIINKVDKLDEGSIKIIINNDVDKGGKGGGKGMVTPSIVVPDIEFEEGCNKKKGKVKKVEEKKEELDENKEEIDEKSTLKGKKKTKFKDYPKESKEEKVDEKKEELDETEGAVSILAEVKNTDVIKMFVNDTFPKDKRPEFGTPNLKIKKQKNGGWSLVNYDTTLVYRSSDGKVKFNLTKYSQSTSRIQNAIRYFLDNGDLDYEEVRDQEEGAKLYDDEVNVGVVEELDESEEKNIKGKIYKRIPDAPALWKADGETERYNTTELEDLKKKEEIKEEDDEELLDLDLDGENKEDGEELEAELGDETEELDIKWVEIEQRLLDIDDKLQTLVADKEEGEEDFDSEIGDDELEGVITAEEELEEEGDEDLSGIDPELAKKDKSEYQSSTHKDFKELEEEDDDLSGIDPEKAKKDKEKYPKGKLPPDFKELEEEDDDLSGIDPEKAKKDKKKFPKGKLPPDFKELGEEKDVAIEGSKYMNYLMGDE